MEILSFFTETIIFITVLTEYLLEGWVKIYLIWKWSMLLKILINICGFLVTGFIFNLLWLKILTNYELQLGFNSLSFFQMVLFSLESFSILPFYAFYLWPSSLFTCIQGEVVRYFSRVNPVLTLTCVSAYFNAKTIWCIKELNLFDAIQIETLSREDLASRLTLTVDAASVGTLLLSDSYITIMDVCHLKLVWCVCIISFYWHTLQRKKKFWIGAYLVLIETKLTWENTSISYMPTLAGVE